MPFEDDFPPVEEIDYAPDGGAHPEITGKKIRVKQAIEFIRANYNDFTVVNLSNKPMFTFQDALDIAEALKRNTYVTELRLAGNRITTQAGKAFGDMLKYNNTLKIVDLEDNKIESAGIEAIAEGLAYNRSVELLTLFGNKEPGEGALTVLNKALDYNTVLLKINWRLTSRQSFAITKKLSRNNEIVRRKEAGKDYSDLDPNAGVSNGVKRVKREEANGDANADADADEEEKKEEVSEEEEEEKEEAAAVDEEKGAEEEEEEKKEEANTDVESGVAAVSNVSAKDNIFTRNSGNKAPPKKKEVVVEAKKEAKVEAKEEEAAAAPIDDSAQKEAEADAKKLEAEASKLEAEAAALLKKAKELRAKAKSVRAAAGAKASGGGGGGAAPKKSVPSLNISESAAAKKPSPASLLSPNSELSRESNVSAKNNIFAQMEKKAKEDASGGDDGDITPRRRSVMNKFKAQKREKCEVCKKTVYFSERLAIDGKAASDPTLIFHKGKYYCKPHFKQLFALKGNYNEAFGEEDRKKAWQKDTPTGTPSKAATEVADDKKVEEEEEEEEEKEEEKEKEESEEEKEEKEEEEAEEEEGEEEEKSE